MATNPPIQIGELLDVPAPGSGVKSQFHQEITNRIHHRFTTPAARAAAFTAPLQVAGKGQASYLATGDTAEGPEYFNGVAWRRPWNQPWGVLGVHSLNTVFTTGPTHTVPQAEGLQLVFANEVGNRWLKVTYVHDLYTPGGVQGVIASLDRSLVQKSQWGYPSEAMSVSGGHHGTFTWVGGSGAGAATWRITLAAAGGNNAVSSFAGGAFWRQLIIEDVGPIGAPS